MRLKLLLLIAVFILLGTRVSAASPSSILVNVTPSSPAPQEDTTITLNSYTNDLDSVLIKWSVGGKTISSGIGKKSFSLKAPAAGSETIVLATISLPDSDIETRVVIRPSQMVLLFQANDSYVPPFYRGKALPTPDSEIKVVAMPEIKISGRLVDPKNMTYFWKKDYTNNVEGSGYGKNYFVYVNDYLENSNNVGVVASTIDQNYSSVASINIGMTQPKILFYRNDDNLGTIWQNSLTDSYTLQGSQIIEAVPYFISPKQLWHPRLVWYWTINDNTVTLASFRKNLMPLQAQAGTTGTSRLKLEIENLDKIFQTTNNEINIEF